MPIEKRKAVIVFQDYVLFPHLNIEKNVGFGLKMMGKPKAEIKSKVDEMLSLVSLEGYNKRYPHELSGGQKQRVAIARALISNPRVILADEPTGALDSQTSVEVIDLLKAINQQGVTVIVVTHENEVAASTERIIRMKDGIIQPQDIHQ